MNSRRTTARAVRRSIRGPTGERALHIRLSGAQLRWGAVSVMLDTLFNPWPLRWSPIGAKAA
jgi:hypothetical protein